MTITLTLEPEVEKNLLALASARGVSLNDFVQEIAAREALQVEDANPTNSHRTGQALVDACAKVRGLTDEEVDSLFSRNRSFARPVDFE